ncbi:MAG: hypothetical protein H0V27_00405 [Pyrinomonadaceae bacterium]|nr:hypothetical protein [Pyrinomonadaceae bacterium]
MTFGRSKLLPSYTRKPNFKSHESKKRYFEFRCVNCDEPLAVEYNLLINQVFGWEQHIGEALAAEAKEFYRVGIVRKSQDGGWPSMTKVQCSNCKITHLVYAGVNEVSNSVYFVTLQGITEIITS